MLGLKLLWNAEMQHQLYTGVNFDGDFEFIS